jgi:hypothetical protein
MAQAFNELTNRINELDRVIAQLDSQRVPVSDKRRQVLSLFRTEAYNARNLVNA